MQAVIILGQQIGICALRKLLISSGLGRFRLLQAWESLELSKGIADGENTDTLKLGLTWIQIHL